MDSSCIIFVSSFAFRIISTGNTSITLRQNEGVPSRTRYGSNGRRMKSVEKIELQHLQSAWIVSRRRKKLSYPSFSVASWYLFVFDSSRESKEYPMPPCPMYSIAARPIHKLMSSSSSPEHTFFANTSRNWCAIG